MTPNEIKNAQHDGFDVGQPATSKDLDELRRKTVGRLLWRKAVDLLLHFLLLTAAILAVLLLAVGQELGAVEAMVACIGAWTIIHERRHTREKETQAVQAGAASLAGFMGAVVGWALHGHADPKCPVCGDTGRIGNDIPCPRCAEGEKVDEPPKEGKPS